MKLKRHAEIAQAVGDDYGFDVSIIVTIDRNRKLQISGAVKSTTDDRDLCVTLMQAIKSAIMPLFRSEGTTVH